MKDNSRKKPLSRKISSYIILMLACAVTIMPMLYMIGTAFKGPTYIFEFPPRLIPSEPTVENVIF